jgi:hypothetical protein
MWSREESDLKTDALRHLADALSEDQAVQPPNLGGEDRQQHLACMKFPFARLLAQGSAISWPDDCRKHQTSIAAPAQLGELSSSGLATHEYPLGLRVGATISDMPPGKSFLGSRM